MGCVAGCVLFVSLNKQLATAPGNLLFCPSATFHQPWHPPGSWPAPESTNNTLPAKPPSCAGDFLNGFISCYKEPLDLSG